MNSTELVVGGSYKRSVSVYFKKTFVCVYISLLRDAVLEDEYGALWLVPHRDWNNWSEI